MFKSKPITLSQIIKVAMLSCNREPSYVWYKRSLVRDSGRFNLTLKFKPNPTKTN